MFEVVVADDLWVSANREALQHIMVNLIRNAIKYSFEDSVVTIRARLRAPLGPPR